MFHSFTRINEAQDTINLVSEYLNRMEEVSPNTASEIKETANKHIEDLEGFAYRTWETYAFYKSMQEEIESRRQH